jgi:acyl transferase domain-containing protein/acyl carrier protein
MSIAIIGFNGRFPKANNASEFWHNLCQGEECISFFTEEELERHGVSRKLIQYPNYVKASPILKDIDRFDAAFFGFPPKEANVLDPQQRLLLECAWETLEFAGYANNYQAQQIGTFVGSGGVVTSYLTELLMVNPGLLGLTGSFEHLANDKDFVPTRLSYKLNLTGPSLAVQSACSTSLLTVHLACQSILNNECDMALAGGVNVRLPHMTGYLRQRGDIYSLDGHIRTFDAHASGIVFGSGVGLVLLKRLDQALKDGDTIHAVIKGSAANNDGAEKLSYTASSFSGQVACIEKAFEVANVTPDSLSYVEAHGTGTVMGDPIEVAALNHVFNRNMKEKKSCGLGSVKANVGHLDTAAGVVSLIKTIMMLKEKKIPPQINISQLNPKIHLEEGPFYINSTLTPLDNTSQPLRVGVNSLGIGGTNVFMLLEEAPEKSMKPLKSEWPLLLNLSAKNKESLEVLVSKYQNYLIEREVVNLPSLCYTSNVGRGQFSYRISVDANSVKGLSNALLSAPIYHIKEKRVGFYLNTLSQKVLLRLQALLPSPPAKFWSIVAEYLRFWMGLGVKPNVVFTSLDHLPAVAYLLGYINLDQAGELQSCMHELNEDALKNHLNSICCFGNYPIEIILLPYYSNLLDFLRSEEKTCDLSSECDLVLTLSSDLVTDTELVSVIPSDNEVQRVAVGKILQELYLKGLTINWKAWYEGNESGRIPLPTYPFKKNHFWISRSKFLHKQHSTMIWDTQKIHVPQLDEDVYQLSLSREEYPVLLDHNFFDKPMLAASVLISWLLEIAENSYQIKQIAIDQFQFSQALFLNDTQAQLIQCVITFDDNIYSFKIRSYHEDGLIESEKWIEHAQGTFVEVKDFSLEKVSLSAKNLPINLDKEMLYKRLEERGLVLSSAYRCIHSIDKSEKEAIAQLSPSHLHQEGYPQFYHPALFDALFQVVQALIPEGYPQDLIFLLSQWKTLQVIKPSQSPRFIYAKINHLEDQQQLTADVKLLNDKHEALCVIEGVVIHRASREIIHAQDRAHYQKWQYVFEWRELASPRLIREALNNRALIVKDKSDFGSEVALAFQSQEVKTIILNPGLGFQNLNPQDGDVLIYPLGLDNTSCPDPKVLSAQLEMTCKPLLDAIQAFANIEFSLIIATQGAVSIDALADHVNPLQMCLWGMGRTIEVEWPRVSCHLIDLDPGEKISSQIPFFLEIMRQLPDEGELAVRKGQLYAPRLVHNSPPIKKESALKAALQKYGVNEAVCVTKPLGGEVVVSIEASGLSYRDHLQFSGILNDNHSHIGDDFVGRVERVGELVKHVKPGDRVIGLAQGTLGAGITVPSYCVATVKASMSSAQLAAWPLAYLTASYCLMKASLAKGQWAFIMSAGSGVGFIAAQLAQRQGINLIVTVNGREKATLLKKLGIENIVNMQDFDWQKRLEAILQGKTIDLIFSSTHPEISETVFPYLGLTGKVLDLTAGRYPYNPAIKEHSGLITIQMYEVIKQDHEWVQKTLADCVSYLQTKDCVSIPVKSYPLSDIEKGMHQLQNPHHIKKIVLMHEQTKEQLFKKQVTYLIVGGLGALGRYLIPWMFQEGADTLCIVDRVGEDEDNELLSALRENLKDTQSLHYKQCDITQLSETKALFTSIAQSLPEIKGIFNIATLLHDAPIEEQNWEVFQKILAVKANGSLNLHHCSLDLDCDYFVMFSSIASLMGSQNQLNYSAANAFQDSLAFYRRYLGLPALAINWSPWQVGIGANMGEHAIEVWKNWGSYRLNPEHDLESLRYLLNQDSTQVALLAIDWQKFIGQMLTIPGYLQELAGEVSSSSEEKELVADNEFIKLIASAEGGDKKTIVEDFLREEVAGCLQILKEQINTDHSFASLGVDSLMAITLRDHIQKKLGHELPAMVIFSYPTINGLSEHILTLIAVEDSMEKNEASSAEEIEKENPTVDDMDKLLDSLPKDE